MPAESTGAGLPWMRPCCRQKRGRSERAESDGSWRTGHEAPSSFRRARDPSRGVHHGGERQRSHAPRRASRTRSRSSPSFSAPSRRSAARNVAHGVGPTSSTVTKATVRGRTGRSSGRAGSTRSGGSTGTRPGTRRTRALSGWAGHSSGDVAAPRPLCLAAPVWRRGGGAGAGPTLQAGPASSLMMLPLLPARAEAMVRVLCGPR